MAHPYHPYQRIADDLQREIVEGRIVPGAVAPSVRELAKRYGVAHMTANRALQELRGLGLLVTQARRTVVRPQPQIRLVHTATRHRARQASGLGNWNAEVLAQGGHPEQQLLHVGQVPAPADIALQLKIAAGAPVVARRRRHLVDGVPFSLQTAYYPVEIAAGTRLEHPLRIVGGAQAVLEERLGQPVARFAEDLIARMPTAEEARALQLATRGPVVRILRTAYGLAAAPVEVLDSVMVAERHAFHYEIEWEAPPPPTPGCE